MNIDNFYDAWWFIMDHPKLYHELNSPIIYIEVVKVNPDTETREDNEDLNTATRVWVELLFWDAKPDDKIQCYTHVGTCDTGGKTYEEAVLKLAANVKNHFGDWEE